MRETCFSTSCAKASRADSPSAAESRKRATILLWAFSGGSY
jgi:hypothetical protein